MLFGLMMSYPIVFGFDIKPVGSLVLVDVFGVVVLIGMGFTVVAPLDA